MAKLQDYLDKAPSTEKVDKSISSDLVDRSPSRPINAKTENMPQTYSGSKSLQDIVNSSGNVDKAPGMTKMKKGGGVKSSASKRADGVAKKGHTKGVYL